MQRQKEEEQRGREWEQGQRIINDVLRGETFRLLGIKHGLQGLALDFQRDYLLHGPIGDPFGVDPDMPPFQRDMIDALISSGNRFAEEHARKICNEWNDRVREMMKKHKEKQAVDQEVSVSSAKPVTEPDPIKNMFSIVEDFDKLVAEGRELHRQKNYGEAIAKYKEALKLYNNDYKQVHDPKAAIALIAAYKAKGGLKGKMAAIVVDLKWKLEDERRKREEP